MRRKIIILLPMLIFSTSGVLGGSFGGGLRFGYLNDFSKTYGFSVGVQGSYSFTKVVSLAPEILFSREPALSATSVTKDTYDYLEIPILTRLNFRTGKVKPFVRIGPSILMLTAARSKSEITDVTTDLISAWGPASNPHFNVTLDWGVEFSIRRAKIDFSIRTKLYLTDPTPRDFPLGTPAVNGPLLNLGIMAGIGI